MPIAEALIAKILGDLATSSFRVVCSLGGGDDSESTLPWSVALKDSSGVIVGILSGDQAEDVANFLRSAEVANLCQAHFLCRLGEAADYTMEEIQEDIGTAFAKLAQQWCTEKEADWSSLAGEIWSEVDLYMGEALPASAVLSALSPTDLLNFRELMGVDISKEKAKAGAPKFLRDLVSLSLDLTRLDSIQNNVSDIKRHFAEYYNQIRLEHAQHDYRIQIDELYVHRDLVDWESRNSVDSSKIFSNAYHPHMVVTGDPGVGKSTFTEYLIWTLAQEDLTNNPAPLIISCREYAVTHDVSIFSVIREKLTATLHLRYTDQDIEDILALGRAFLIVDGVDEILDLGRRRELIRAVEMLTRRFPLCPIVATTRNIGYSQARFNSTRFRRYELRPFSESQIQEYVRRWFSLTTRADTDVDRFLVELESIPDLRSNPLMLSLLCILYRARGHIPRNRRQIYSQCADLLFNRWDRMRHIEQPYDHLHYGDELMQEVAIWFYNSQSAQAGLEEQQIRKVITLFLIDTAAVPKAAAEKRASAFLDFCADRAWLLGSAGTNSRGQRLFVFTHRTFMEFFAAESLARGSIISKIVSEVAKNYDRDASSVLPDLIVQSAEVHRKGGARDIIQGLFELDRTRAVKDTGHYLPLCLRIVNLSPVNPRLMEEIFQRVFRLWSNKTPSETRLSIVAALDMYRDPRNRFKESLTADSGCLRNGVCKEEHAIHPIALFLIRWSNLYHAGATLPYQDEWGAFVDENVRAILSYLVTVDNDALWHFMVKEGYLAPEGTGLDELVTTAFDDPVPGYVLESLCRVIQRRPEGEDLTMVRQLAQYAAKRRRVYYPSAEKLDLAASLTFQPASHGSPPTRISDSDTQDMYALALWVACVTYEVKAVFNTFHEISGNLLKIDYKRIFDTRDFYIDKRGISAPVRGEGVYQISPLSKDEIEAIARDRPPWFAKWCYGRDSLIR